MKHTYIQENGDWGVREKGSAFKARSLSQSHPQGSGRGEGVHAGRGRSHDTYVNLTHVSYYGGSCILRS